MPSAQALPECTLYNPFVIYNGSLSLCVYSLLPFFSGFSCVFLRFHALFCSPLFNTRSLSSHTTTTTTTTTAYSPLSQTHACHHQLESIFFIHLFLALVFSIAFFPVHQHFLPFAVVSPLSWPGHQPYNQSTALSYVPLDFLEHKIKARKNFHEIKDFLLKTKAQPQRSR